MEHSHKLLKQAIAAGLALGMAHGALANEDKITKGFYSMDAMGCMLLKECTNGVERINSSIDLMNAYPDANWDYVKDEFDQIMIAFKKIGVHVHLADGLQPLQCHVRQHVGLDTPEEHVVLHLVSLLLIVILAVLTVHDPDSQHQLLRVVIVEDAVEVVSEASVDLL